MYRKRWSSHASFDWLKKTDSSSARCDVLHKLLRDQIKYRLMYRTEVVGSTLFSPAVVKKKKKKKTMMTNLQTINTTCCLPSLPPYSPNCRIDLSPTPSTRRTNKENAPHLLPGNFANVIFSLVPEVARCLVRDCRFSVAAFLALRSSDPTLVSSKPADQTFQFAPPLLSPIPRHKGNFSPHTQIKT